VVTALPFAGGGRPKETANGFGTSSFECRLISMKGRSPHFCGRRYGRGTLLSRSERRAGRAKRRRAQEEANGVTHWGAVGRWHGIARQVGRGRSGLRRGARIRIGQLAQEFSGRWANEAAANQPSLIFLLRRMDYVGPRLPGFHVANQPKGTEISFVSRQSYTVLL
jgi:hypothetical protein